MERTITVSISELDRMEVFSKLKERTLTQMQAANILGVSCRQVRRLFKEYRKAGPQALISKKRGKPSNHRLSPGLKDLGLALIREHYPDFGPTLAHEKLIEVHKLKISLGSVRKIMITNELWTDKKIKKTRIYQLRERRSREGELVQIDGSPHDWFEGRAPKCTILLCVDDATGKIKAAFFSPTEDSWGYFDLMQIYFKTHGRPIALYSDKHGVFRVNRPEALSGNGLTQFGRAMKEIGVKMLFANSPQAKGRIERTNRILQDRLVKELRLNKISTIEEANAFLPTFIEDYNRRFAVVPKDPSNAHRPLSQEQDLDSIFTIREFRQLSKNLTFQYQNVHYQIQTDRQTYALRKAQVTVREKKDGSVEVFYKDKLLAFTTYVCQEKQGEVVDSKNLNAIVDNLQKRQEIPKPKYKPTHNHPWRRMPRKWLKRAS